MVNDIDNLSINMTNKKDTYNLYNISVLSKYFGNPQDNLKSVIHVAGTNGKGSTITFLKSIMESAGYSVNAFFSPHVINTSERIIIHGNEIKNDYCQELQEKVLRAADKLSILISFFELYTMVAFLAFDQCPASVTLIEVGLGGRLDATNILTRTLANIITTISYDHERLLGNTLENIAVEKAGIIKSNSIVFIGKQTQIVMETISKICHHKQVRYFGYGIHFKSEVCDGKIYYTNMDTIRKYDLPKRLEGEHQIENLTTVLSCVTNILSKIFDITDSDINMGINKAVIVGRLQKIYLSNIRSNIWFDGAHNNAGAIALFKWARKKFPMKNICLICAMRSDKDQISFLNNLSDAFAEIYYFSLSNDEIHEKEDMITKINKPIHYYDNLQEIISIATRQYDNILIAGSFQLMNVIQKLK